MRTEKWIPTIVQNVKFCFAFSTLLSLSFPSSLFTISHFIPEVTRFSRYYWCFGETLCKSAVWIPRGISFLYNSLDQWLADKILWRAQLLCKALRYKRESECLCSSPSKLCSEGLCLRPCFSGLLPFSGSQRSEPWIVPLHSSA